EKHERRNTAAVPAAASRSAQCPRRSMAAVAKPPGVARTSPWAMATGRKGTDGAIVWATAPRTVIMAAPASPAATARDIPPNGERPWSFAIIAQDRGGFRYSDALGLGVRVSPWMPQETGGFRSARGKMYRKTSFPLPRYFF